MIFYFYFLQKIDFFIYRVWISPIFYILILIMTIFHEILIHLFSNSFIIIVSSCLLRWGEKSVSSCSKASFFLTTFYRWHTTVKNDATTSTSRFLIYRQRSISNIGIDTKKNAFTDIIAFAISMLLLTDVFKSYKIIL